MLIRQLQREIETSSLSTYRISRLARVDLSQLSKFQHHGCGLSLASAGRVCDVLGLRLNSADDEAEDVLHGVGHAQETSDVC